MAKSRKKFHVFLSHKSVDKPWVNRLKDALEARGLRVWLDQYEIRPGDLFVDALEKGLESSQSVALIVSPEAMQSGWVKEEYNRAMSLAQDKNEPLRLIPVILRRAKLPGFLSGRNWVDFTNESSFNESLERLIWGITNKRLPSTPSLPPRQSKTGETPAIAQTQEISIHIQENTGHMADPISQTNIAEIAAFIQNRKHIGSSTVLFLGSRTSGLYGNSALYAGIKNYSSQQVGFDTLSADEKFRVCHEVLERRFNQSEIHTILQASLAGYPRERDEDICIADLIRKGYFDLIISTSIDSLLDSAIEREKVLASPFNPRLVVFDGKNIDTIIRDERRKSKIIKIFGNMEAGLGYYNTVRSELALDDRQYTQLKDYLHQVLQESILIIGYDPLWDRPLERAFLERGKDITYVNEESPVKDSLIDRVIRQRMGKSLLGEQRSYKQFMKELCASLP